MKYRIKFHDITYAKSSDPELIFKIFPEVSGAGRDGINYYDIKNDCIANEEPYFFVRIALACIDQTGLNKLIQEGMTTIENGI